MSGKEGRPFERGDIVELRGIVVEVDPFAGKALVDLGRDAGRAWVPVRRLKLVVPFEDRP